MASKARRNAASRSGGTPGVVKKAAPTSAATMMALSTCFSSVVTREIDGGRDVRQFGMPVQRELHEDGDLLLGHQSGWPTLTAVQEVEWPSTSPRSTASCASADPL